MTSCIGTGQGTVVVPFVPRPARVRRLNVTERIAAMNWADAARACGVRDLRIHESECEDDPARGPFVLIYEQHDLWAAWGIAVHPGSFEVWRPSSGMTVGWYRTLGEALLSIKDVG
jgi:hypothetical protein